MGFIGKESSSEHVKMVSPTCSKKASAEEEELEIERWSDECECMWLSSDSKSSSFSFDDDGSWEVFSFDSQDLFPITRNHDLFFGMRISAFDGSSINPIEEASLVLDRALKSTIAWQDDLKEEVVAWLLNSAGDDFKESSSICSKSFKSTSEKSFNGDSLSEAGCSDSSVTFLNEDSPSESVEETAKDEFDVNGPLFWPFEHRYNWNSEILGDFFIMSPLKNGKKVANVEGIFAPKSIILRLHESKKHKEKGLLSPRARVPTTVLEWTTKDAKKDLRRISTMPSRLSKSTQCSIRKEPVEIKDAVEEPTITGTSTGQLVSEYKFLEEDFRSCEEIPIETLVGLGEFDGHEGVDTDPIEDFFSLDESLNKNPSTLSC